MSQSDSPVVQAKMPITIPELKAAARDYDDRTITEVTRVADGYSIACDYTCVFLLDKNNRDGVVPAVGDTLRVYGELGRPIYGMDLNGTQIYWKTPKEREAERAVWLAEYDREKRERYERERAELDETVANFPEPLRKRIERYRAEDTNGEGRLTEAYEIFCCAEAVKIADVLRPHLNTMSPQEAVEWFRALPPDEQKSMGLSGEHSGNTYGGACRLAFALLDGRDV